MWMILSKYNIVNSSYLRSLTFGWGSWNFIFFGLHLYFLFFSVIFICLLWIWHSFRSMINMSNSLLFYIYIQLYVLCLIVKIYYLINNLDWRYFLKGKLKITFLFYEDRNKVCTHITFLKFYIYQCSIPIVQLDKIQIHAWNLLL